MAKYKVVKAEEVANCSDDGELRMMRDAIDSDQITISYRMIPAGFRSPHGHTHSTMDEVIFVFRGTLDVKLDDKIIQVGPRTALKISPVVKRGYHNNSNEDVEMLVASPQVDFVKDNGGVPDEDWWR